MRKYFAICGIVGGALDDEVHKLIAQKGIWRVGTKTPLTDYHTGRTPQAQNRYKRQQGGLRNAYSNQVKVAFSTDADYYIPGMTRGQVVIDFLTSWKDADIPAKEILRIMTIIGYQVTEIYNQRGPIKACLGPDRGAGESAGEHRYAARCPIRDERRYFLQEGRHNDAGKILP